MIKDIGLVCLECGKQFFADRMHPHSKFCCKKHAERYQNRKRSLSSMTKPHIEGICENPKCGKQHDGSYGAGRFCCEKCKVEYTTSIARSKKIAGNEHGYEWKCTICGEILYTRRALQEHRKEKHPLESSRNWNKGLTKETSLSVKLNAEHVSASMKKLYDGGFVSTTQTAEYWTEERRRKKSEEKKQFYKEHPEMHPNVLLANNREKMSYPERVAYDWLTKTGICFKHHFYMADEKRYPDFYIPCMRLIIEIDGKHWHDEEKDSIKDKIALEKYGIVTLRIFASTRIEDSLYEFFFNRRLFRKGVKFNGNFKDTNSNN